MDLSSKTTKELCQLIVDITLELRERDNFIQMVKTATPKESIENVLKEIRKKI
jgi:hypothetical protein